MWAALFVSYRLLNICKHQLVSACLLDKHISSLFVSPCPIDICVPYCSNLPVSWISVSFLLFLSVTLTDICEHYCSSLPVSVIYVSITVRLCLSHGCFCILLFVSACHIDIMSITVSACLMDWTHPHLLIFVFANLMDVCVHDYLFSTCLLCICIQ